MHSTHKLDSNGEPVTLPNFNQTLMHHSIRAFGMKFREIECLSGKKMENVPLKLSLLKQMDLSKLPMLNNSQLLVSTHLWMALQSVMARNAPLNSLNWHQVETTE